MKKIKFDMDQNVSIYVPSTVDVNKPIDNSRYVNGVEARMTKLFGGTTTIESIGSYTSNSGTIVTEKVTIVSSFTTKKQLKKSLSEFINVAELLKGSMSQESVLITINNKAKFV